MNRRKALTAALFSLSLIAPTAMMAQYPQLNADARKTYDVLMSTARAHSDSAWAVAKPIVDKEAREGRPYVPWASRPDDLLKASIPAFPGAEGGGMYTPGGRGGKVITVTNLNDSGPGSFREACETGGARIVVFNVAGVINLKTPLYVRAPYITIAGQTAPGDGVCIAGESFQVDTHDVIVRHMRFRRGDTRVHYREDSFGGNPVGNIMIDHCSAEWGLDENISFYRHMYDPSEGQYQTTELKLPTVNVTIQNTISAKALDTYNHAFGSTLGGENCMFARNLWASNSGRNPSIGWNGVFNFVNNVVFNWVHRSSDGGDYTAKFNMINNYYKPGPATPKEGNIGHRILKPEAGRSKLDHKVYGRVFAEGNIMEGFPEISADNWAGGIQIETDPDCGEHTAYMRSKTPFDMPYVRIASADEAYDFVLKNAGANIPCRDIIDQRIIEEVRTGVPYYDEKLAKKHHGDISGLSPKSMGDGQFRYRRLPKDSYKLGIITDPMQMGGYPEYKGTPYVDSDGDGMPDAWEIANGLNPNDPSDANGDCNGDGYTNIEKYINGISTKNYVDWKDLRNNYDTLAAKGKLM
ncbi:thrombospondin type 3 repeat-containing protein [uncultured Duncaniella sp.]|uniref:thrombospondin type 3 repeat-containing protein n=2 Tax=uncultured Duncaniella sp. TaxID=2768039 RepID=UPI0026F39B3D|nr:thrombospondin type 3 repeat-containing protein [uncultured Duncaniella sp.]